MATIDELYQQALLGQQPVMGELPTTLTPYQRIMAQMTPTMNPYMGANVAIGGYDPALYNRRVGSGLINFGGGGGGMGGGMGGSMGGSGGGSGGGFTNQFSDLTPAQQAAYYAENPTMAGITRAGQGLLGYTGLGMLQNYFNPGFVNEQGLIAMGVDPAAYQAAKESFRASEIADMNGGFQSAVDQNAQAMQSMQDAQAADTAAAQSGGGGGYSASDYGGYSGSETQSSGESYANFNGGLVSNVFGPDPAGPDEGAGYLQRGEYVIKKSAVKKYGQGLLDMINDGKIPAKKMKSLLG
jgi:hypothetical protein